MDEAVLLIAAHDDLKIGLLRGHKPDRHRQRFLNSRSMPGSLQIDSDKEAIYFPCMIAESTLTAKNQTTVPKAIVDALGLKPSAKLVFEITDDGQLLVHVKQGRLAELAGFLAGRPRKRKGRVSLEEMKAGVPRAAGAAYLRSIGRTRASLKPGRRAK